MYTVEWARAAENELARIWLRAADRAAVNAAQAHADRLLARDPAGHGRHVSEGLYQFDCPPLAVSYTIDDQRRYVHATRVREIVSSPPAPAGPVVPAPLLVYPPPITPCCRAGQRL